MLLFFFFIKWKSGSSPKPGHIERSNTISTATAQVTYRYNDNTNAKQHPHLRHTLSEDEAKKLDEECMQRFLKINSKLITAEKYNAVDGILLITPSALMFDPKDANNEVTVTSTNETTKSCENNEQQTNRKKSSSSLTEHESIIIPIEIISNVILYEDLSLKDIHNYFKKK